MWSVRKKCLLPVSETQFYEVFLITWYFTSDIGDGIMRSRTSGTYQVMPKVGPEGASQKDESILYKEKGQSKLLMI